MGGAEAAAAAGYTLSPATESVLAAWRHHVEACTAMASAAEDPRRKLHKQLADKRKQRTKAKAVRAEAASAAAEGEVVTAGVEPKSRVAPAGHAAALPVPRAGDSNTAPRPARYAQRKEKVALRAKAPPFHPQAVSVQARGLPDRLGDLLGN